MNASASWPVLPIRPIRKLLVANRSGIAIRVLRAAAGLGIKTVAIYAAEDRFSLHRLEADESYPVGGNKKPADAYRDIEDIIAIARACGADAIHPGYGCLSDNADFAEACAANRIAFIGPSPTLMRTLGSRDDARAAAVRAGVPVLPATGTLPADIDGIKRMAAGIGYPLMLKKDDSAGCGTHVVETEADLARLLAVVRSEAPAAGGNDGMYLEKLVRRAHRVEVQIVGDLYGNRVHLFERDCPAQHRHQEAVEQAPAPCAPRAGREALCGAALRLADEVDYTHAGTVEFLVDADTGEFYFIKLKPCIQVEHMVTGQVTGIDSVKTQIRISEGAMLGEAEASAGVPDMCTRPPARAGQQEPIGRPS